MAALAAIADHEDGYLVRLLLQHSEHDELKPGRLKRSERNKKRSELSNRCATRVFHYSAIIFAKNHHSLRHICSFSRKDSSLWRHACQSMSFIDLALQAMFCSLYLFYTFVYIYIHTHTALSWCKSGTPRDAIGSPCFSTRAAEIYRTIDKFIRVSLPQSKRSSFPTPGEITFFFEFASKMRFFSWYVSK